jgi:Amidohydrolase family
MSFSSVRPRAWTRVFLILCLSLGSAVRMCAQGGEPRSFAIRGAKVVPVTSPPVEDATVVVSRGIITAIGTNVTIAGDAWIIEGKGLIVYPGLIDGFTDVGLAPAQQPGGAATAPAAPSAPPSPISRGPEDRPATTPWRNAADEVNLSDSRIESWRAAGFTTTISAPKSGIFPGQAVVLDLGGERPGSLVVKAPVAIPVTLQGNAGFRSFPGSLMGSIAYVRQVWLDTNWSTQAQAVYEKNPRGTERPKYDRSTAALAEALGKHAVVLVPANTTLQIRRALQLADEWKLSAVLYGAQMGYEAASELASKKISVLVDLKWPEAEKDSDPDVTPSLQTLRFRDRAPSTPAALEKAGVKFAFYSGGIAAPKDVLPEVKKAIDAGLSPEAALRALTLSAAEIFGVANVTGSIEKGKIANLVVTDGDLFDKKTKVKMVFVDGRKYEVREPLRPSEPPKGDLTGKWKLNYTTPGGEEEEGTADLTMASDGTLTGTLTSNRGTANIYTGYVSADKFNFSISLPVNGNMTDATFTGTFEGKTMKGSISVLGYNIEFTGTKPGPSTPLAGGAL